MFKTYTQVGTALSADSNTEVKVANSKTREATLTELGFTNIKFIELPYAMEKYHAIMYAIKVADLYWEPAQWKALNVAAKKAFSKSYC